MGELQFDHVWMPALLVQQRRGHGTESVPGHFLLGVSEATQSDIHGVFADGSVERLQGGEEVLAAGGDGVQLAEPFDDLSGEGHDVKLAHFHSLAGYAPLGTVKVDLAPFGIAQLARPHEGPGGQLQGVGGRRAAAISIDCPGQGGDIGGIGECGTIPGDDGGQGASEVGGDRARRDWWQWRSGRSGRSVAWRGGWFRGCRVPRFCAR